MGYWGRVASRAAHEAAKDLKLNSPTIIVVGLAAQAIIALILYLVLGVAGVGLWTRLASAAAPFATFPVAFLIRMATVPPVMDQELQAQLVSAKPSSPIRLSVGENGRYVTTTGDMYTTIRTFRLCIVNADPVKALVGLKIQITEIQPDEGYALPDLFEQGTTVAAGDQHYVALVDYREPREARFANMGDTIVRFRTATGRPLADAGHPTISTIRATAIDTAYTEIQIRTWVENGRFRIEVAG